MFSRQGVFIDQLFRAILARIKNIFQVPQIGHRNQNPSVKMVVLTFQWRLGYILHL